ncbi:MAG: proton-conducting transporter membrane subunit [Eubacteriales bacterium]|nr:proton-conducting transporter membrane subunit [Eubacteriales bacterium]
MNRMLLCVPALLPLIGGMVLLLAHQAGRNKVKSGRNEVRSGRNEVKPEWNGGQTGGGQGDVAGKLHFGRLEWYILGLTVVNSLVLAALIWGQSTDSLVLFRLYGDMTVMFRLDGMGRIFAGLIAFLWPLAVLYSFEYMRHEERKVDFFAFYLMTYGVTAGIALSGNLITLYLFYEMLTLVTFPLVLHPMTREARRASRKYLYYSIGGAAFAFLGLVFVLKFSAAGNTNFLPGGVLNLAAAGEKKNVLLAAYLLSFFGFGVKAALFPLHGWLPKATVAPTPVTALLHAVAVVKSGAFAILRLTYFGFGIEFLRGTWAHGFVMAAAMISIAFGSTMAAKEAHWKRRLAYSTVSNLSYILLAATMMSPLGLVAALSHMVFHAFMKICSFFCAGAVMHQTGKTHVYELDGLGRQMPVTFGCLTIASLSLIGIPLFAGFISKWNIARAAFDCGAMFAGEAGAAGGNVGGNALGGLTAAGGGWTTAGSWTGFLPYLAVGVLLYSAFMTAIYMLTVLVRAYAPVTGGAGSVAGAGVAGGAGSVTGAGVAGGVRSVAGAGTAGDAGSRMGKEWSDPNWLMLAPLVIFAVIIIIFGVHSQPLMEILYEIGGAVA